MQYKVSIVGAGPAGFALAADLKSQGVDVLVYSHPAHLSHACHVVKNGGLKVHGAIQGSVYLYVTQDISHVIAHARTIILTVPSSGQETIIQELKRFPLHQHTIVAVPGNLVSLIVESEMKVGNIFETNLSPYSCRMSEGELVIMGKKSLLSIAALRRGHTLNPDDDAIQSVLPIELKWCHNVVEVCLSNINGVFHPPMMLMNAGRIENTTGDFLFYRDGLTQSVAKTILAIDQVRLKIGMEFGFRLKSAIEVSNECYDHDFTDLVDLAQNSGPHNKLKAPPDLRNRNFTEDVADLLVSWHGLAEKLGIDASPLKAVIVLVEMATGTDYMESGRSLKKLNLDGFSRQQLLERFGVSKIENNVACFANI